MTFAPGLGCIPLLQKNRPPRCARRGVTVETLAVALDGYAAVAQPKVVGLASHAARDDERLASFAEVLADINAFADPGVARRPTSGT